MIVCALSRNARSSHAIGKLAPPGVTQQITLALIIW